jgi:dehydrogenase/reductase SDR family member 12
MLYRSTIDVACSPEDAFSYVSDFSHVAEWDPGVVESRALGSGTCVAVGSRFELIALFRGKRQRFEYVVTALEEGRRIRLEGDGEKACSTDEISVEEVGGITQVTYEADIRLKGALRVAEPFLGRTFRSMGDAALDGLRRTLGG